MAKLDPMDLVGTIESDEEIDDLDEDEEVVDDVEAAPVPAKQNVKKRKHAEVGDLAGDFVFEDDSAGATADLDGWQFDDQAMNREKAGVDIDELIKRRRTAGKGTAIEAPVSDAEEEDDEEEFAGFASDDEVPDDGFGAGAADEDEEAEQPEEASEEEALDKDEEQESDVESEAEIVAHPNDAASDASDDEEVSAAEKQRQKEYFADEEVQIPLNAEQSAKLADFRNMNLSRPILRALTAMNFASATPIQAKAIPVALMGKDVVGGAVTGSGKTAAFMIPILERLLYRPKKVASTRVLVLCPTRELAMQCHAVAKKLAAFTDIKCALVVGGLSLKVQEAELRTRPDVVIATPGRFIDHFRNSQGFTVENIEIMVMDEADRMLEEGFADELNEIINACPRSRQTMLFSATMTDKIDDLVRLSLNKPVRLLVNAKKETAEHLIQEFVRIRPQREHTRSAILVHLCQKLFKQRCIVFFRSKVLAHRMRVIFGILGMRAGELHGNLSQEQRVLALESFRDGRIDFLLATDLASRGLDIKGIDTVINYEAPQSHEIYLHRVGRTARAGRQGRSVTLAGENDRKVVKAAVKSSAALKSKVQSRALDAGEMDVLAKKLQDLEEEIEAVLKDESQERQMRQAEMELKRGENNLKYREEIQARPRRTWFTTEDEKQKSSQRGKELLNGADGKSAAAAKQKQAPKPISNKDKKRLDAKRDRKEGKVYGKRDKSDGPKEKPKSRAKKSRK
ncbi:P-loop containing nucleoside triphosphate hydrolase protein [Protomyces lactucae-debilis]|uniref:ATP-dependent RNA helicase DRS1 n=1 Tax=Protomyces lactucae-debilis TaxID=2754530 RepID=A0A1Y2FFG6_PROLT|nr:P-loop containing nucleoside triphosphate hydrolase protein [Protomyces lactucae-debilis]ORY82652.1 P-loop containing nucleoside triphosphate hydrolase protein [Protomyces lactucae-debilis]